MNSSHHQQSSSNDNRKDGSVCENPESLSTSSMTVTPLESVDSIHVTTAPTSINGTHQSQLLDQQNVIRKGRFIVENVGSPSAVVDNATSNASCGSTTSMFSVTCSLSETAGLAINGYNNSNLGPSTTPMVDVVILPIDGSCTQKESGTNYNPKLVSVTETCGVSMATSAQGPVHLGKEPLPVPSQMTVAAAAATASGTPVTACSISTNNNMVCGQAPEIMKKGRFMVINTSTTQDASINPQTPVIISSSTAASIQSSIAPPTSLVGSSSATTALPTSVGSSSFNVICNEQDAVHSASFVSTKAPLHQLHQHLSLDTASSSSTTTTTTTTTAATTMKTDNAVAKPTLLSSNAPSVNGTSNFAASITSTRGISSSAPAGGISISLMTDSNLKKGQTNNVGKVYHFLDEIKQEVQELDKVNRTLQNDMKFFRDKNKELEGRNRELEKKLLEERNLRELAESKTSQMKKKMAEMKRLLAMFTSNPEENNNILQSPSKASKRAFSSCDDFKVILDEDDAENNKTHRKTTSLFGLDEATRLRSNSSVGADSSSSPPTLPQVTVKPAVKVVTKEKPFIRPPLPTSATTNATKPRKESHDATSSTFHDLCVMENASVKLVATISDNFIEHDTTSSLESLTNNVHKVTSKTQQPTCGTLCDALSAFDPMAKSTTDKLEADNLDQIVVSCADPFEELACRKNAEQLYFEAN